MPGEITPYGRRQLLKAVFTPDLYVAPSGLWFTYTRQIPVANSDGSMLDEPTAGFARAAVGVLTSTDWAVSDFGEAYNTNVVAFAAATADLGYLQGWAVVDTAGIGTGNCYAVGSVVEPFTCDNTETPLPADVAAIVFGLYD